MNKTAHLVIGADSLVGGSLVQALKSKGHRVYASTRRSGTVNQERVLLDFTSSTPFVAPADTGCAYVVAAATNYQRCASDPMAHFINTELTPRLIGSLLEQGIFVVFVSTNAVFGGQFPWPDEEAEHHAQFPYAAQKHEAELKAQALANEQKREEQLNIVRLTKILSRDTPPLPTWFEAWKLGEAVRPFADLIFAPMSRQFVGQALATIGEKRVPGAMHLSGAENVSYVDLAKALAQALGLPAGKIDGTTATAMGVDIPFKPLYSGLGMRRTTALTGLRPQPLDDVVRDLLALGSEEKGDF